MKMRIGAITVGQSPRTDVTSDIMRVFDENTELIEIGALDGMTLEEIEKLAPSEGDYILVSRMKDGTQVTFAERLILPRLQSCIEELERSGVELIMFFCTGEFPCTFKSGVPIIFPSQILNRLIPLLCGDAPLIVVTPAKEQLAQARDKWKHLINEVAVVTASPYGKWEEIDQVCREINKLKGNLVVMDCIGYSRKMKNKISEETGRRVVLSRTMLARIISELTDTSI